MGINITNGATASRFYNDGSGELLAVFQYMTDAKEWAKGRVKSDMDNEWKTTIVVTCLYSGDSVMIKPEES